MHSAVTALDKVLDRNTVCDWSDELLGGPAVQLIKTIVGTEETSSF